MPFFTNGVNFQVPKFIEIEDKIFGPLTFKQFLFVAGGLGLAFLIYVIDLPLWIKLIPMLAVAGFGIALAFYKVNERPLIITVEAAVNYFLSGKLYLWRKTPVKMKPADIIQSLPSNAPPAKRLPTDKLKDLTWSLNIQEKLK